MAAGKVLLVGAGPGAPDLIAVRGINALRQADVVLYDRLTHPALLDFAGRARKADLFRGTHGKQPLRQAMAGRLPQAVLDRRKRGWTSPYATYLREMPDLRSWLSAVPDHPIVAESEMGREVARAVVTGFLEGNRLRTRDAWMLGRIVLWHQVCVEDIRSPFGGGTA